MAVHIGKREKLLLRFRNNPKTVHFEEIDSLLLRLGFEKRQTGSQAMRAWIETAQARGITIPEPQSAEAYSGKFVIRVPRSLHRDLVSAADRDGVSLNTFVNVTLARAIGVAGS